MTDWMPVFHVKKAMRTNHAAHPDHRGAHARSTERHGEDFLARIGTAVKNDDGSFSVQLDALPLTGSLLIREPRDGDHFDPTRKGGR